MYCIQVLIILPKSSPSPSEKDNLNIIVVDGDGVAIGGATVTLESD